MNQFLLLSLLDLHLPRTFLNRLANLLNERERDGKLVSPTSVSRSKSGTKSS